MLVDSTVQRQGTLILAHGAGAPMDSPFMNELTSALNQQGIDVVRFEFPYMQQRRDSGKKRPPDRQPVLLESWQDVYRQVASMEKLAKPLLIGGKSMGGRMATLIAETLDAAGVCCFGYPFHPPGKLQHMRTEHLKTLQIPTLIIQGTRDPFGKPDELSGESLSETVTIEWLEAGDHDFKPTVRSGFTQSEHIVSAAKAVAKFIQQRIT